MASFQTLSFKRLNPGLSAALQLTTFHFPMLPNPRRRLQPVRWKYHVEGQCAITALNFGLAHFKSEFGISGIGIFQAVDTFQDFVRWRAADLATVAIIILINKFIEDRDHPDSTMDGEGSAAPLSAASTCSTSSPIWRPLMETL
jgi:hypothetical protein